MTDDDSDILARALRDFAECEEAERENRAAAEDDTAAARCYCWYVNVMVRHGTA